MAPEHYFSKLKLDPSSLPKRFSSTFSSLKRSGHHGDGAPSTTPQPELAAALSADDLVLAQPQTSDEDLSNRLRNGEDLDCSRSEASDDIAASSTASDLSSIETSLRRRGTSISFAHEVTLENGDKRLLEQPLTRSEPRDVPSPVPTHVNGIHISTSWENGHEDRDELSNSASIHHGIPLDRRKERSRPLYRDGEVRQPLLCTTPNDPPPADDKETSLTSDTTASTILEEPRTPLNEYLLSPDAATTSPIEFSPKPSTMPWPGRRSESTRSRSYNRSEKSSMASARRRSSRSANSSMSPASAFLSQWGRVSQTREEPTEPDDEGQEIGDSSGWIIGRKIGYGGFSVVKEVSTIDSKTGKRLVRAVKIVRKNPEKVKDEAENERVQAEFEHEVSIWRFLRHKYILPLVAVYDTPFATFCITKLNVGGTLHDLIRSRRQQYRSGERGLSAPLAKRYTYQLAAALRYLHEDVHVVHRDIKLENCLIDMSAPDAASQGGNILLCDFGMADFIHNESRNEPEPPPSEEEGSKSIGSGSSSSHLTVPASLENRDTTLSIMGSLEYAAPELINATTSLYSPAADIWAFGVVVYALLTGSLPFSHAMREKLVVMIEKTMWDVSPLYAAPAVKGGGLAGTAAVDLVKACLTYDAGERWDISNVLASRWLLNCREVYGDGCFGEDEGWG